MAERHVTIGGQTYPLEEPFLVVATQNPIEQEGTYPLPEAQLDRFMMEIHVGYPSHAQEKEIVMRTTGNESIAKESKLTRDAFLAMRSAVRSVPVPDHIADYAVSLCAGTRPGNGVKMIDDYVAFGAGPRGSQNLVLASKARALIQGRTAPILDDLLAVATSILRHRIIVNHRAIGDGVDTTQIIASLIKSMPVTVGA